MELKLRYRPYGQRLLIGTELLHDLATNHPGSKATTMEYPSEGWHVMVTSYDGQFTGMTAMNIETHGSTWTLWLTDWLSDETIFMIEGIVKAWQDEVSALVPASDIHPKMKYETTITV